jgi:hypothetical protein
MTRSEFSKFLRNTGKGPASNGAMPQIVEVKVFELRLFFGSIERLPQSILPDRFTSRVNTTLAPRRLVNFFARDRALRWLVSARILSM